MPKIFRNIRKQLASENKTAAYLRYAMGEIILVVIGILIALEINAWNSNRIDKVKTYSDRTLRAMNIALDCLDKGILPKDKVNDFNNAIIWFYRFNNLSPDFSTLEEMKSAGDLGLIYNINLRNEIVALQNQSEAYNNILLALGNTTYERFPIFDKYIRSAWIPPLTT